MPRDAVSRTANVERNGGHKILNIWRTWVVREVGLAKEDGAELQAFLIETVEQVPHHGVVRVQLCLQAQTVAEYIFAWKCLIYLPIHPHSKAHSNQTTETTVHIDIKCNSARRSFFLFGH